MERILLFCTISALVFTLQLTMGTKLSLRTGPEDTKQLKNCTMCPRHYKPICASNGRWYHNACFMACEVGDKTSVGILYEGECRPEHMQTQNPAAMDTQSPPDMDTQAPPNMDTQAPDAKKLSKGACEQQCPPEKHPVCATDGKWYHNACYATCNEVLTAPDSMCSSSLLSSVLQEESSIQTNCTSCSKVYDPVCMTNGNWYYNTCVMQCILGIDNGETILYHGKCIHF